jgi:hypothetical protein
VKIVAALLVLLSVATASAQSPSGECLDPYAAPPAPPPPAYPCTPQPSCPPPPACPPSPPCCAAPAAPSWVPPTAPSTYLPRLAPLGRGWYLNYDERGQLVAERMRRTPNRAAFGIGLTTFLVSYFGAGLSGALTGMPWNWVPVAGPLTSAVIGGFSSPGMGIGYAFATALQIGGLVLTFVGGAAKKVVERRRLDWGGWARHDGGGVMLSGHF